MLTVSMLLLSLSLGTRSVVAASLTLDPAKGYGNFVTTVRGYVFTANSTVNVTLSGIQVLTNISVGADRSFSAPFVVPVTKPGAYTVTATDAFGVSASATLTVVDTSPLSIELDVGSIHFRGEIAEFYALTTFGGTRVNVTSISAFLYPSSGTRKDITVNVTRIDTGLYRIPYAIPTNATEGTYVLVVDASYSTTLIESKGSSLIGFILSPSLTQWNAWLTSIQSDIATVKTDVGIIKLNVSSINTRITSIEGDIVTLQTDLGTIETDMSTIKPMITRIRDDMGVVRGNLTDIMGDLVTIVTDVGAINGTVTALEDDVFTIETDVGTIKAHVETIDNFVGVIRTDVSVVKATTEEIRPVTTIVSVLTGLVWGILILSLVAAVGAVTSAVFILRKKT